MRITYLGGAQTVTGSKYLLETEHTRILLDCGLFQGYKWLRQRNWQPLPLGIEKVDAVVLSHAHLDHSGALPILYSAGYRGPIYTHHATAALCGLLLPDSGRIQEEDAKYLGKHKLSKHENPKPLYDEATAQACLRLFKGVDFGQQLVIGDIKVTIHPAGHLLGAGFVVVEADGKRLGFSGDVGRPHDVLMEAPQPLPPLDMLLLESTYGDRLHPPYDDPFAQLEQIINEASERGGAILIPSFSVGRAQLLQHMLATLMDAGRIHKLPIFLDSPMAIRATAVYQRYHEHHKLSSAQCDRAEHYVTYTQHVEDSKAIAEQTGPHIIIAGSGMATGGRILHHFKHWLGDHRATLVFAGHQAAGTRGAKIQQGVPSIKVHGQWLAVKAQVRSLEGLSGHADYQELLQWLQASAQAPALQIRLVHGDEPALEHLRDHLLEHTGYAVEVAEYMRIENV